MIERITVMVNGEMVGFTDEAAIAIKARDDDIAELVGLLAVSACPNRNCSDGSIPHQVGDGEWEAEQCQFCYEKDAVLAKHKGEEQ